MHKIQEKLLKIIDDINLKQMSLRQIARLIGEEHPQKIAHHFSQLEKKRLVKVDKNSGGIKKIVKGFDNAFVNIPIFGCADCGPANMFADENMEGFLKISKKIIGGAEGLFAVKAKGASMNKAKVNGKLNIEDGDYVIVDKGAAMPNNGDYVLSVIDETANIKRYFFDKENNQIALMSESTEKFHPIYIHPEDKFMINGAVRSVIKPPKEEELWQNASAQDILKDLGPISKKEVEYYENL